MKTHNAILVVVTGHDQLPNQAPTGIWFEEYAIPTRLFKDHGKTVVVASIRGGAAPIDPRSLPEQTDAATAAALQELQATLPLKEVQPDQYDAVFFPGGHGTMFDLPQSQELNQLIVEFLETGRIVAAVCHGPAAFTNARFRDGSPVVKGRRLTGFTDAEERAAELDSVMPFLLQSKMLELGADFVPSPNWRDHVVVDGNLITGQNPQSSASTAQAILTAMQQHRGGENATRRLETA